MATHSSVLACRIPGTGEPGGLPSMGSHRVGHNWSNLAAAAANPKFQVRIWKVAVQKEMAAWGRFWSCCIQPLRNKMFLMVCWLRSFWLELSTHLSGRPGYRIRAIQSTSESFLAQKISYEIGSGNPTSDKTHLWASLMAQVVKNPPAMQETQVWSLGWEDLLEKGMATHFHGQKILVGS